MQSLKFIPYCFMKKKGREVDVGVVGSYGSLIAARCLLLACLAYFCARAVNSAAAMWLALSPAALQEEHDLPPPAVQPPLPLSAYAIVYTRDIFNSVNQVHTTAVPASSGPIKLWGTARHGSGQAFAILEEHNTRVQGLYREGETIAPGIRLVQVDWEQVIIERNGQREVLTLPTELSSAQTQPVPVVSRTRRVNQKPVQRISQDTFQIDRRAVEHAMNNLNDLFTQVRAVPYSTEDGGTQGFRLFAIKVDSLIDRLGIKNGDIVQRVNGVEISDPSSAFALLQDLQGHSQIQVDILRNHQPITLSYEIR